MLPDVTTGRGSLGPIRDSDGAYVFHQFHFHCMHSLNSTLLRLQLQKHKTFPLQLLDDHTFADANQPGLLHATGLLPGILRVWQPTPNWNNFSNTASYVCKRHTELAQITLSKMVSLLFSQVRTRRTASGQAWVSSWRLGFDMPYVDLFSSTPVLPASAFAHLAVQHASYQPMRPTIGKISLLGPTFSMI